MSSFPVGSGNLIQRLFDSYRERGSERGSLEGQDAYRRTGQSPVPAEVGRLTSKARFLNAIVLEGADAATLTTAVNTWLKAASEADFVSLHPLHTAAGYSVMILYTET